MDLIPILYLILKRLIPALIEIQNDLEKMLVGKSIAD
ncbi:hypothetical protein SDC9_11679 [bioreactor metagenome]|uniref:Uncharacterized protein n=1 Tax=bioreactor metagenome TaxID=1076179 RepID=A0A644TJX5_9ZZZZ